MSDERFITVRDALRTLENHGSSQDTIIDEDGKETTAQQVGYTLDDHRPASNVRIEFWGHVVGDLRNLYRVRGTLADMARERAGRRKMPLSSIVPRPPAPQGPKRVQISISLTEQEAASIIGTLQRAFPGLK